MTNKKKKILFISDDIRFFSGVAVSARELITQTVHKYDYVQIGGASQHPEAGKVVDVSPIFNQQLNITDAYVKIYATHGYGDANILLQVIEIEKPDAILMETDPRFYGWLFNVEAVIHSMGIPICYWSIWDCDPYPMWNRPFYDSCAALFGISQQSHNIHKWVCDPLNCMSLEGEFDKDGNLIN